MLRKIPRYPRRTNTRQLQQQLEEAGFSIDVRSIQRDLNKLSEILSLVGDGANPQSWQWLGDADQLDLPTMEPQAALVFYLAETHLRPLLPQSTMDYLAPWFHTARGVLDANGNGFAAWRDKVAVLPRGQSLLPPDCDAEVEAIVYQALLKEKQVDVTYRPRGASETKTYLVNPLGLVVRNQVSYLVCTMWHYPDIRQLVLHRIRSANLREEAALRPEGFGLEAYIAQGEFSWPVYLGEIRLVALFTPESVASLYECPLSPDQKIEEVDEENVQLTATVLDTQELRTWLLGFGDHVKIVAPAELRAAFGEIAGNLADYYSATE